jgi:hypothetical protein
MTNSVTFLMCCKQRWCIPFLLHQFQDTQLPWHCLRIRKILKGIFLCSAFSLCFWLHSFSINFTRFSIFPCLFARLFYSWLFFRYAVYYFLFLCSTLSSHFYASLQWIHSLAKSVLSITFPKIFRNTSVSISRHISTLPGLYVAKPLTFMSSVILSGQATGAIANWI